MLERLAFAIATLLALLLLDRVLQRLWRRVAGTGPAARIVDAAEVFGTFLIAAAAVGGCVTGERFADDVLWLAVFGITALVAFDLAAWLGVRVLGGGAVFREVQDDNLAAGVFAAGHVVATGVLAASLFAGRSWLELAQSAGFFLVAQFSLHCLAFAFRKLTTYDDAGLILSRNLSAGLAHAGVSVAMGILVAHAADGPYLGLGSSLGAYGLALAEGLALYPVRQVFVQCVVLRARPTLRGGALDQRVVAGDLGAGALEAATYLATALLVRSLG